MLLKRTIDAIDQLDQAAMETAQKRMDNLIKPPGSLGDLEHIAIKIAGITKTSLPIIKDRCVITMGGDHGVVEEGVSAADQDVTWQMMAAMVNGAAGVSVLARHAGAKHIVVDIGVAKNINITGVQNEKVCPGTNNIAQGPAMTPGQCVQALETGIKIAQNEIDQGATLIALGDMGIGNTTPSSAVLAALGQYSAAEVTGRGTLINDAVLEQKRRAVARALEVNQPDPQNGMDVLAKVGGLEIAGLAGVALGCAAGRVPVLLDGFITTAAALIAAAIQPKTKLYMLASHLSGEPGHQLMLDMLGLKPMLMMDMRLGEGSGAALAMPVVEAACKILNEMATFQDAGVLDMVEDKLLKH